MAPRGRERWLVTGWPGMGNVAVTAAVYLMAKLRMHQIGEFDARDLFELEHIVVAGGIVRAEGLPRSRLFMSETSPYGREIVVFTGEAQPALGKLALCHRLLEAAQDLGVTKVFTFAAAASEMEPTAHSRVLGIATDKAGLSILQRHEIPRMEDGRIAGLNGILLAAAAEAGLPGIGLLGEMPVFAPNLPYPSAAAAVLRAFAAIAEFPLDLSELDAYGQQMQEQLSDAYRKVREALSNSRAEGARDEPPPPPPKAADELPQKDAARIEELFKQAVGDRSKAFDLKRELDKLGAFRRYEDRFLDLFKKKKK